MLPSIKETLVSYHCMNEVICRNICRKRFLGQTKLIFSSSSCRPKSLLGQAGAFSYYFIINNNYYVKLKIRPSNCQECNISCDRLVKVVKCWLEMTNITFFGCLMCLDGHIHPTRSFSRFAQANLEMATFNQLAFLQLCPGKSRNGHFQLPGLFVIFFLYLFCK